MRPRLRYAPNKGRMLIGLGGRLMRRLIVKRFVEKVNVHPGKGQQLRTKKDTACERCPLCPMCHTRHLFSSPTASASQSPTPHDFQFRCAHRDLKTSTLAKRLTPN